MIFNVALQPGTMLSNVLYYWIASGAPTIASSSGVTVPDSDLPVFRIDSVPPTGAEELIVYDSTAKTTNWNLGGYPTASVANAILGADQVLLTAPYVSTTGPSTIIPGSPAEDSICRCYGTWKDISALSVDGAPMTLTLVAVDNTDPTLIYDLSATPLKNTETDLLVAQRVISVTLLAGQLVNVNGDIFVDLNRTDYIRGAPTGTDLQYLLTCDVIGAPMGMQLLTSTSPIAFQTVLFELNTATIGVATGGTFDLSMKAVT